MLLAVVLFAPWCAPACATEQINDFHSDITVHRDGSMDVVETIDVVCEQDQIKHGIYRDFPTTYKDNDGSDYVVGFDIRSVGMDGSASPYHTERRSNGVRIYIGDRNSYVSAGRHEYAIAYTTDRQLGFFGDRDELYWNVTGNGWMFPIQNASARITLPAGIRPDSVRTDGWTGPQGATNKDLKSRISPSGIEFSTTAPLGSYEGLTILVSWPKGFVDRSARTVGPSWLLREDRSIPILIFGLIVVLGYFTWAQRKVGIDPAKHAAVPQWEPPDGLGPGAIRYIRQMGYENKALAAALIGAAIKGCVRIDEREDGDGYTLRRLDGDMSRLTVDESAAMRYMLGSANSTSLTCYGTRKLYVASQQFRKLLESKYRKGNFSTNAGYAAVGIVLSVLTIAASTWTGVLHSAISVEGGIGLMFLWGFCLLASLVTKRVRAARFSERAAARAGGMLLFALLWSLPAITIIRAFAASLPIPLIIGALALALTDYIFCRLLKAYTVSGRALMDRIDGFRLYIKTAEGDQLNEIDSPNGNVGRFEKLLPYAIALDVTQQWSERFAEVFAQDSYNYEPDWYHGQALQQFHGAGIGSSIAAMSSFGDAFSSAISSSSSHPGSSSGGSGGSSGGGGGGGGGGGW